jgi:hypothetical protein
MVYEESYPPPWTNPLAKSIAKRASTAEDNVVA